jgi:4-hydroxy-tetrahydrodipicolinate reductase
LLKVIENSQYNSWTLEDATDDQIHIEAKRIGTVPGTHTVTMIQVLTVKSKQLTIARICTWGSIGKWIIEKQGVFTMKF